ncbi:MAG: hypothetical protein H7144_10205 [Burkholderiales bacterium]|nr:hypothetical protein [Phycisphaerae bacterium]
MAWIIDYQHVLVRTRELGLHSVYYNSGAFAHADGGAVRIVGWLGPADPTIRMDLPATMICVEPPYEQNLADQLLTIWPARLAGPAWVLPKSHWSFELDHGSRAWLPGVLEDVGIDPGLLEGRAHAAAIQFEPAEPHLLHTAVRQLLTHLVSSDFAVIFPQYDHLVTVHHHKQLWWQTLDSEFADLLVQGTG